MRNVEFTIKKELGQISSYKNIHLRIINWNGQEKYDLRSWDEYGKVPYKGLTLDKEELGNLLTALQKTINYATDRKPIHTAKLGYTTAVIYHIFGEISKKDNFKKLLTYTSWNNSFKFDIRSWSDDFTKCKKGITLNKDSCQKLLEIIENELHPPTEITLNSFIVQTNILRCEKKHELETIQAIVPLVTSDGQIVAKTITAGYCKFCDLHFMLEQEYWSLRSIGIPLCKMVTEEYYKKYGKKTFDGNMLKPNSVLNLLGYSVNAQDNLSAAQRQMILVFAVESKLYSIIGICNFLDWLMEKSENISKRDMSTAISKWQQDRDFISNYEIGSRPISIVNSITKRKYI